jgi:hypothetical protein
MIPIRVPDGLLVPKRAEGDGVIGDGMVLIRPDDPDYAAWERVASPPTEPKE